ncbi:Hypothetical protein CINCED_3A024596 [Cinara cedri]|uniref:RUN domain-containing protein n=1 Tax=Cinara cedri TaxID=506608 RepID=A0A5E4NQ42_9HEMI|nr:Hypothetical protein CINCED_3A024596 [Cinara cedri]
MEVFEMFSEKDKPILVIFNFKFRFHKKLANNVEKWCCSKKYCKSFFKRYNKEILIKESKCEVHDHNHEADTEPILKRQKICNGIKRMATENICEKPSKLIQAFKESGVENLTESDMSCIRRGISNARKKMISSKPTNIHEVHDLLRCVDVEIIEDRDPVLIERRNLVNISKLIVKELIENSLKNGRMLDSDHAPLQHFFIVLEHVLRHGLRPKKGLLGPKKELWDILQIVEKLTQDAKELTNSIRDLPTVKTQMGRARAWLRVALMQKKLADYLKILVDNRDEELVDYFEPDALMMSDEAIVIVGLMVGLNVIDCNLCIKEEDLDSQQGVIDFSLYLRSSHHPNHHLQGTVSCPDSPLGLESENMNVVLDQKNYIEELNCHLKATVANLESKVETLTTSNTLIKEELDMAKTSLATLKEENQFLKNQLIKQEESKESEPVIIDIPAGDTDALKQFAENEKKQRIEAEKELHLQMSLKAEMEVAMKLLEKESREKQENIVSLRKQLDDIKTINLEMYKKLQVRLYNKTECIYYHNFSLLIFVYI